jgi:hypothetical protein
MIREVVFFEGKPAGRFLRIIEANGLESASIIVPATGLIDFHKLLADMVKTDAEIPAKPNTLRH